MKKPLRILLVGNSEDEARLLCGALQRGGFTPVCRRVENDRDAAEALAAEPWDICLCGDELPGFPYSRSIPFFQKHKKEIPLIVVSGAIGEEAVARCMRQGARDFVRKDHLSRLAPAAAGELAAAEKKRATPSVAAPDEHSDAQAVEDLPKRLSGQAARIAALDEQLREAEKARAESEEKLREFMENAPIGVCIADLSARVRYVNRKIEEATGWSRGELRNQNALAMGLFDEETKRTLLDRLAARLAGDEPRTTEVPVIRRDGSRFWVNLKTTILKKDKVPRGLLLVFIDVTDRKEAEKKILESEEKYRALVENAQEAILIAQGGLLRYVNRAAVDMFGAPYEKMTSTPFAEFIHPEDRETVMSHHRRRLRGEKAPSRYTVRVVTSGGYVRWAEIRATVMSWEGSPAALNFISDITQRRTAEEKLQESEERFRALFDSSQDCVYVIDLAGGFIDANAAALQLLGYDRSEIPSLNILSLLDEADLADGVTEFAEIVRTGHQHFVGEHTLKTKDGGRIFVETRASLVYRDGKPHAVLGIARDTTQRRTAEMQLRRYADEISDLYNNAPCGYHTVGPDGTFRRINDTELKWLGYEREDIVGKKKWSDLMTAESAARYRKILPVVRRRGEKSDVEFDMVRRDGSVFPVLLNARADRDDRGRFLQIRCTTFDITQLKKTRLELHVKHEELTRAYDDLRRKQEMIIAQEKMASIGMLAAGVAHEIKNPLAVILQGVDYLQATLRAGRLQKESLTRLNQAVQHADRIVQGLLSFARQMPVAPVRQDIRALLDDSLILTEHEFHAKNISLVKEYPPDLPGVAVDGNQLKQVFVNLILNAIEAMPARGELTIRAELLAKSKGKQVVRISFRDTGRGIPTDRISKIFDPFYTTKAVGNTGLGLSVSKGIIDMHGGILYAESENGKGTNMVVELPVT
ncbi:MAG: PAS domain S-box protein [Deltaproteobacteria bacterium]|nr:PAS domain S-box protein [Deltaproteobacteria bacterium]